MLNAVKMEMENRGYECEIREVVKNGVSKLGLTFGKNGNVVRATVYEDSFREDESVSEIADRLEEIECPEFNVNDFTSPEFIKSHARLCVQKKGNEDIVKEDYLDLEAYVRVYISDEMSFKLQSKTEIENVMETAIENTKGTFAIKGMSEIMAEMMGVTKETFLEMTGGVEMQYVVTNENNVQGAAALYYKGIFKEFCRDLHIDGCYIIPSSIHELIVLPVGSVDESFINGMISEVNETQVDAEEQLSDHYYYYNLENDEIAC